MKSRIKPELEPTLGAWGWIQCECAVHTAASLEVQLTYQCGACGNSNLRFIHTVVNPETNKVLQVGIECAGFLTGDFEIARIGENEVQRKERWRKYYERPGKCYVTVADLKNRGKL